MKGNLLESISRFWCISRAQNPDQEYDIFWKLITSKLVNKCNRSGIRWVVFALLVWMAQ